MMGFIRLHTHSMDRHGREQKAQLLLPIQKTLERNGGNVASTARECKVSRQNIIRWRKKGDEIFNGTELEPQDQEDENNDTSKGEDNDASIKLAHRQLSRRNRKRKALDPLMEDELVKHIREISSRGIGVHRNAFKIKAQELMPNYWIYVHVLIPGYTYIYLYTNKFTFFTIPKTAGFRLQVHVPAHMR